MTHWPKISVQSLGRRCRRALSIFLALIETCCTPSPNQRPNPSVQMPSQQAITQQAIIEQGQCVHHEAHRLVWDGSASKELNFPVIDVDAIVSKISTMCSAASNLGWGVVQIRLVVLDEKFARIQQFDDQLRKTQAEQRQRETEYIKKNEGNLLENYRKCLIYNVDKMAISSNEAAETIVDAALAACHPQRMAIEQLHVNNGDSSYAGGELMDMVEVRLRGRLLLEVLSARATHAPSQTPSPTQPEPTSSQKSQQNI